MPELRFSAKVRVSDMAAAQSYIKRRVRKSGEEEIFAGLGTALFAVMMEVADGLHYAGLPSSEIASLFDQMKRQVLLQLETKDQDR